MQAIKDTLQANTSLLDHMAQRQALYFLVARGYHETIHYSFVNAKLAELLQVDGNALELSNPISHELSQMRTSLWPSLLASLIYHHHRQIQDARFFERGTCFHMQDGQVVESLQLAGLVAGQQHSDQWNEDSRAVDFYDIKADVNGLLGRYADEVSWQQAEYPCLHPGQSARLMYRDSLLGFVGALHPRIKQALDLPMPVFLFNLHLDRLPVSSLTHYQAISKYPFIRRDIALLVDMDLTAQTLTKIIQDNGHKYLQCVKLFDVYIGASIPKGKKSVAVGLIWRHHSRTLTDDKIDKFMQKILASLKAKNILLRE